MGGLLGHVDDVIDEVLTKDYSCDIALPRIKKRWNLETVGALEHRKSVLEDDFQEEEEREENDQLDDGMEDGAYERLSPWPKSYKGKKTQPLRLQRYGSRL